MLTRKQSETLEFIKKYIDEKGIAPTTREIAEGIGILSRGVAHRYIAALAKANKIELIANRRRNIKLVEEVDFIPPTATIPLEGKIAAGHPIEAVSVMETLDVAGAFLGSKTYALLVSGDSMIDEGIHDGDYVICEHTNVARNGDIVVALIDNQEATLKRLQYHDYNPEVVLLVPANPRLSPMEYDVNRVQIQGIFKGLLRLSRH